MKVATSPAFLEACANHPRVFPSVASVGRKPFELSGTWADCLGLEWDSGGVIFHRQAPGVVEAHVLFLPKTRDVVAKAHDALRYLFTHTDTHTVQARTPTDLPHSRRLAVAVGMTPTGRFDAIQRAAGPVALDHFQLTRDAWTEKHGCLT